MARTKQTSPAMGAKLRKRVKKRMLGQRAAKGAATVALAASSASLRIAHDVHVDVVQMRLNCASAIEEARRIASFAASAALFACSSSRYEDGDEDEEEDAWYGCYEDEDDSTDDDGAVVKESVMETTMGTKKRKGHALRGALRGCLRRMNNRTFTNDCHYTA
jgi:hypothetical protein